MPDDFGSEQQQRLELAGDSGGLDPRAWDREDPDAGPSSRRPVQLEPVEGDGPPVDTDQVGVDAGAAPAAGPEQAALHVEPDAGE